MDGNRNKSQFLQLVFFLLFKNKIKIRIAVYHRSLILCETCNCCNMLLDDHDRDKKKKKKKKDWQAVNY